MQNPTTDDEKIVIDLSFPPATNKLEIDQLIHRQLYEDVTNAIGVFVERARKIHFGDKTDHVHHVIFIDGEPGTGKSTFLLNLDSYIQKKQLKTTVLSSNLDPNRWPRERKGQTTQSAIDFLLELVAIVSSQVEHKLLSHSGMHEDYRRVYEQLTAAIEAHLMLRASQGGKQETGQSGATQLWIREVNQTLQHLLSAYLEAANKIFGTDAMILKVDDVDVYDDAAHPLMEMLRIFAVTPRLIVVWASDKNLVRRVLRDFISNEKYDSSLAPDKEAIDKRIDQYWRKVISSFSEFRLQNLNEIIGKKSIELIFSNNSSPIDYKNKFNAIFSNKHYSISPCFDSGLRDWLEMLYATKSWWIDDTPPKLKDLNGLNDQAKTIWKIINLGTWLIQESLSDAEKCFIGVILAFKLSKYNELPTAPSTKSKAFDQTTPKLARWLCEIDSPTGFNTIHSDIYLVALIVSSFCEDWSIQKSAGQLHDLFEFDKTNRLQVPDKLEFFYSEWKNYSHKNIFSQHPKLSDIRNELKILQNWREKYNISIQGNIHLNFFHWINLMDNSKDPNIQDITLKIIKESSIDLHLLNNHPLRLLSELNKEWEILLINLHQTFSQNTISRFSELLADLTPKLTQKTLNPFEISSLKEELIKINDSEIFKTHFRTGTAKVSKAVKSRLGTLANLVGLKFDMTSLFSNVEPRE